MPMELPTGASKDGEPPPRLLAAPKTKIRRRTSLSHTPPRLPARYRSARRRFPYFTVFPRMYTWGTLQNASPSADVRTASARFKFIHESMDTSTPEYVSPFLSSTSTGWPVEARSSVKGSCERGNDRKQQSTKARQSIRECPGYDSTTTKESDSNKQDRVSHVRSS